MLERERWRDYGVLVLLPVLEDDIVCGFGWLVLMRGQPREGRVEKSGVVMATKWGHN